MVTPPIEEMDCMDLLAYQDDLFEKLRGKLSKEDFDIVLEIAAVSELIGEF